MTKGIKMTDQALTNGPSADDVKEAFNALLRHQEEIASEQGKYMQRCAKIRSDIATVYDQAKDKGIAKKVLRAKFKHFNFLKKADKAREDLELDEQNEFDMLTEKLAGLADLPLGRAALDRVSGANTLDRLVS